MLELIIDPIFLLIIIFIVARGAHTEYFMIFLCAVIIWIANYGIFFLLAKPLGVYTLIPAFAMTVFIIWGIFKLSIWRALIASALFFSYKVLFIILIAVY